MTKRVRINVDAVPRTNDTGVTRRRAVLYSADPPTRFPLAADDYEVGYKKPPISGQFKKGQSGNPRGRPRGEPNLNTAIDKELKSVIVIQEGGGGPKKISKTSAIAKRFVNQAVSGNPKAISKLLDREGLVSSGARTSLADTASPFSEPSAVAAKSDVLVSLAARLQSLKLAQELQTSSPEKSYLPEKNVEEPAARSIRRRVDPDLL